MGIANGKGDAKRRSMASFGCMDDETRPRLVSISFDTDDDLFGEARLHESTKEAWLDSAATVSLHHSSARLGKRDSPYKRGAGPIFIGNATQGRRSTTI